MNAINYFNDMSSYVQGKLYSTDRKDQTNTTTKKLCLSEVEYNYIQTRGSSPNKESLESVTGGRAYCPTRSSTIDRQ